jgi:hypothetical protein
VRCWTDNHIRLANDTGERRSSQARQVLPAVIALRQCDSGRSSFVAVKSHARTVPSHPAVSDRLVSGQNASSRTRQVCAYSSAITAPDTRSQTRSTQFAFDS